MTTSDPFRRMAPRLAVFASLLLLGACAKSPPQAVGTLEFDRVSLPAPAAERIIGIDVREGEQVAAGQPLLELDPAHT